MRIHSSKHAIYMAVLAIPAFWAALPAAAHAGTVTDLYNEGIDGSGVNVAQIEANLIAAPTTTDQFEAATTHSVTYIDFNGHISTTPGEVYSLPNNPPTPPTTTYTDSLSTGHATIVGGLFYGSSAGSAKNVAHVDNYDATGFQGGVLLSGSISGQTFIPKPLFSNDAVINQSFINNNATASDIQFIDAAYDYYTNYYTGGSTNTDGGEFGPIFVSAIGNGGFTNTTPKSQINPPASAYNGISVGVIYLNGNPSGTKGPTFDGRSGPDIVSPLSTNETSYSTPTVSAAVTMLVQAGGLGPKVGASYTGPLGYSSPTLANGLVSKTTYETDSMDERTVKALLLNGAVKPTGWTHTHTAPLDINFGSGIVNDFNSVANLQAGKFVPTLANALTTPISGTPIASNEGWDFNSVGGVGSTVNHYVFNPGITAGVGSYVLTATLDWNATVASAYNPNAPVGSQLTFTEGLANLDLELFDVTAGTRLDYSESTLDNLQQLYTSGLTPGHIYDLQVTNLDGAATQYALAFNFASSTTTVPEPASLTILGMTSFILIRRKRRHISM